MFGSSSATDSPLLKLVLIVLVVGAASQWWSGRQAAEAGKALAAQVQAGDIRMLSSETCSVCVAARTWFEQNHVAFSECLIERDPACRQAFEATGSPGTPVMLVRGQVQVGFSPEAIRDALKRPGA